MGQGEERDSSSELRERKGVRLLDAAEGISVCKQKSLAGSRDGAIEKKRKQPRGKKGEASSRA